MDKLTKHYYYLILSISLFVCACSEQKKEQTPSKNLYQELNDERNPTHLTRDNKAEMEAEHKKVLGQVKKIAQRDWPNDFTTQEFWINQQMDDYTFMQSVPSNPLKEKAQNDWPLDFTTQKFWYQQQLEAKQRIDP